MDLPLHHRWNERALIKARLLAGASLLMLAPRRIGKTWLLGKIVEDMGSVGWRCIRLDVGGRNSEEAFMRELCTAIDAQQDLTKQLWAHVSQRFKQVANDGLRDGLVGSIGRIDHHAYLGSLVEALNRETRKTLILIDEFALLVLELAKKDPDATRNLLYHLRKLQQAYPNVAWYLTGSIGLDVVTRRFDMSGALLGIDVVPLDVFSPDEALSFLDELQARGEVGPFALPKESADALFTGLGWLSPYYLRQIALVLKPTGPVMAGRPAASADDVERAFQALLTPAYRGYFAGWEEHIDKNFEAVDSGDLHAILDVLCDHPDGEKQATIAAALARDGRNRTDGKLREHLRDLESDGYLVRTGQRWAFRSGLLRRFWLEYKKP